MKRALLVVDVQTGLVVKPLYQKERFLAAIGETIRSCREEGDLVVFIQHCGGAAKKGKPGWDLYPALDRRPEDPVVEKQRELAAAGIEVGFAISL